MSSSNTIMERYLKIIEHIRNPNRKRPTVKSIQEDLEDEGFYITKRSLQRDILDIPEKTDFEIVRKGKHPTFWYEIESVPEEMPIAFSYLEHTMMAGVMRDELQHEKLDRKSIIFDHPQSEGTQHIPKCVKAIRKNQMLSMDYHKFGEPVSTRIVCPYYLKQFRKRWYLIARDTKDDKIKSFGLDRIEALFLLTETFTPEKNLERLYKYVIGFFENDARPEKIQLWSESYNAHYIRTLRLHHSQKEVGERDGGIVFELNVVPNFEFYQEVLRMSENVKIIGPEHVKRDMKDLVNRVAEYYK